MSHRQTVWVDVERCTGCGACVEVCPVEAMTLRDGIAWVDNETCTGCQACVDACPQGAVQPLVHGEIVAAQERPAPTVQRSRPLAETAGVAIAAAGASVLVKLAGALARSLGHWLAEGRRTPQIDGASRTPSLQPRRPLRFSSEAEGNSAPAHPSSPSAGQGRTGRGRRTRRRRRGE
jgi:NAD-dependent dihydropyrimidine dehydrogenase PreA subunit